LGALPQTFVLGSMFAFSLPILNMRTIHSTVKT